MGSQVKVGIFPGEDNTGYFVFCFYFHCGSGCGLHNMEKIGLENSTIYVSIIGSKICIQDKRAQSLLLEWQGGYICSEKEK